MIRTERKFGELKIQVLAQYYENYSDTHIPHWKPKGGRVFELFVSDDALMYEEKTVVEALKDLCIALGDSHNRYEYRSFEKVWHTPELVDSDAFHVRLEAKFEALSAER